MKKTLFGPILCFLLTSIGATAGCDFEEGDYEDEFEESGEKSDGWSVRIAPNTYPYQINANNTVNVTYFQDTDFWGRPNVLAPASYTCYYSAYYNQGTLIKEYSHPMTVSGRALRVVNGVTQWQNTYRKNTSFYLHYRNQPFSHCAVRIKPWHQNTVPLDVSISRW